MWSYAKVSQIIAPDVKKTHWLLPELVVKVWFVLHLCTSPGLFLALWPVEVPGSWQQGCWTLGRENNELLAAWRYLGSLRVPALPGALTENVGIKSRTSTIFAPCNWGSWAVYSWWFSLLIHPPVMQGWRSTEVQCACWAPAKGSHKTLVLP